MHIAIINACDLSCRFDNQVQVFVRYDILLDLYHISAVSLRQDIKKTVILNSHIHLHG